MHCDGPDKEVYCRGTETVQKHLTHPSSTYLSDREFISPLKTKQYTDLRLNHPQNDLFWTRSCSSPAFLHVNFHSLFCVVSSGWEQMLLLFLITFTISSMFRQIFVFYYCVRNVYSQTERPLVATPQQRNAILLIRFLFYVFYWFNHLESGLKRVHLY